MSIHAWLFPIYALSVPILWLLWDWIDNKAKDITLAVLLFLIWIKLSIGYYVVLIIVHFISKFW